MKKTAPLRRTTPAIPPAPSTPRRAHSQPHRCRFMRTMIEDHRTGLRYNDKLREYSISYRSGGSMQVIRFCPGCGKPLPASLRDKWFNAMEKLGIDPWLQGRRVPVAYRTGAWWRSKRKAAVRERVARRPAR